VGRSAGIINCSFIHEYCRTHGIDKLLFLARDGEIIKKIYDKIYPNEATEYVYSSRVSNCKLMAGYDKNEYFKKLVYHKVNQGYSFEKVFHSMELEKLIPARNDNDKIVLTDKLNSENIKNFVEFLNKHWEDILDIYRPQRDAAGKYFKEIINSGEKIGIVDIGWAGSGAIALRTLAKKEWVINADIISFVAGTNTATNAEPFMSEGFLQSGTMVSYLYSSSDNRDLWKKHNPSQGFNLFFELLTSSAQPSFKGFYLDRETMDYRLEFLEQEKNPEGIMEIQKGIEDFVDDYMRSFGRYDYMLHISGRDAYAPMIVAASHKARYLNAIYQDFELKTEVGL
jgi:hypothetical protein